MDKLLILLFFCLHIISDFFVQTDTLAGMKRMRYKFVIIHSFMYFLMFIIVSVIFLSNKIFFIAIVCGISHYLIDTIKYKIEKRRLNTEKKFIFTIDQILHISFIVASVYVSKFLENDLINNPIIKFLFEYYVVLQWLTAILLILKPTNIIFRIFFGVYKPKNIEQSDTSKKAGSIIGILERVLILIFIAINSYASIGLIFTAKSIARFNKINEDSEFAEYYLIGTLFSVISTVITYLVIFQLFKINI